MNQVIYSAKTEIDQVEIESVRITKFTDGEVESSYITTRDSCDCPAGVRPSCRHRQMLPRMIAAGIVNSKWFWDFDLDRPVDFDGQLKSNVEAMNELAAIPGITIMTLDDPHALHNAIAEAIGEPTVGPAEVKSVPSTPWRRF